MADPTPAPVPVTGVTAVPPQPASTVTESGNVAVAAKDHAHPDVIAEPGAAAPPKVLPLGGDVHPEHQAQALEDAPDHLVEAQIEKTREAVREHHGLPEEGSVVPGFEDSKLWAMRRRFDAQVLHVLSPPTKLPPGEPDLRPSTLPNLPFSSDLIKTNTERVYATAGIWGIYSAREAARLMSWAPENRRRTGAWCAAYFITWWFGLTLPACCLICIIMIMHAPSRKWFFPPVPPPPGVPPSATDPTNRKGDESIIAGVGHPIEHRSKAEQIEQQAWEFTNTVQRFGARVVVGGHHNGHKGNGEVGRKQADSSSSSSESSSDDELDLERIDTAQDVLLENPDGSKKELTAKQKRKLKAKQAKQKRDAKVGQIAKAAQDSLGDFADALERFANALSPPRPYPRNQARAKLAGAIFAPIMLVTAIVPVHIWANAASFCFGVGFFGQPLLIRAAKKFVEMVPDWQEKLDLRNSIFSGVPTNAQLVLHILRVREMAHDPLPPPPPPPTPGHVKEEVSKTGIDGDHDDHATEVEVDENGNPVIKEGDEEGGAGGVGHAVAKTGKRTVLGGLKLAAKKAATFKADVKVEGTKEKVGTKIDRFLYQSRAKDQNTPESYPAKLHGSSGHLLLTTGFDAPAKMQFVPLKSALTKPTFEVEVADLVEIKKRGVFIGRAVLGWAAGINIEGMGLEMRFKPHEQRVADTLGGGLKPHDEDHEGDVHVFSHVGRRDQLFARLLSINKDQQWEML